MSNNGIATFVSPEQNKYTQPLLFVPGIYTLSQLGQVPYFSAVMPLEDIVNQIELVEEIPEEARIAWSIEELFQRDINWDRVQNELVNGYLKDQNKLNFFNSLTIALLPQDGYKIENEYGKPEPSPDKSVNYENWTKEDVGYVCIEYNEDKSIGFLRWHQERILPVAIDGQHRLAALKEYCKDLTPGVSKEFETKIPLIFLILDDRVGFEGRTGTTLIETLREIFIDLNKNARGVAKSRLILLDDLDIQSFCVRTLIASKIGNSSLDVLPLSMVTWRENEVKFDTGHSITTVLNLNEIVDTCLGRPSLDGTNSLEENEVKKYVNKIKGKLELGKEINDSIKAHHQLCTNREEPFSFKTEHLEAFRQAFNSQWSPYIVRVFREFTPYREYLSKAQELGAIDNMLADYLLLSKENRVKFRNRKKEDDRTFDPAMKIDAPLNELQEMKKNDWAFYVVFQKALFFSLFEFDAQRESLFEDSTGETRESFLNWWLKHIDELHSRGVFNLDWKAGKERADLWKGIANNPASGTIQYSNAAINRITSFITLSIWFNYNPENLDVQEFYSGMTKEKNIGIPSIVQNAYPTLKTGLTSLIKANMDDDDIDEDVLKKKIKTEFVKRLKATQE